VTTRPYPAIDVWELDRSAIGATIAAVQQPGRDGKEVGVFWIGTRGQTSVVRAVVIPAGEGVVEAADFWQVTPEVFGAVSRWASGRAWSLLGICHTHGDGIPAKLSPQDRAHLVRAPGVLAVVIGSGGREDNPQRWGWYEFTSGAYRAISLRERQRRLRLTTEADTEVWTADRRGCQPVTNS
jgi:hypothetical protein